ncbi:MAG TPA: GNAT family N-acetyltransferase [Gemmatimonadaceae bacterium]|nr:GNAT family N-acetyltransferase [Gemmatimonadaceae bacterium]
MGHEADLVAPRFARGCRCFAVIVDGGVAGYGWLSVGPEWIGELQLEIRPRAGEGYIWNCTTVREHRRRGIFRALLVGISEIAFREGIRRLWIGSVAIPAERAVEPAGFQAALQFATLSFARLHCMIVSPSAKASPKMISSGREVLGSREQPLRLGLSIRLGRHRTH